MKRLLPLLLVITLLFITASCGGSGSVTGKFYHDEGGYLELKSDGTVLIALMDDSDPVPFGTYKVKGSEITFTFYDDETFKGSIKGDKLTIHSWNDEDDKEVFTKK